MTAERPAALSEEWAVETNITNKYQEKLHNDKDENIFQLYLSKKQI